jgi:hypothetical protein
METLATDGLPSSPLGATNFRGIILFGAIVKNLLRRSIERLTAKRRR